MNLKVLLNKYSKKPKTSSSHKNFYLLTSRSVYFIHYKQLFSLDLFTFFENITNIYWLIALVFCRNTCRWGYPGRDKQSPTEIVYKCNISVIIINGSCFPSSIFCTFHTPSRKGLFFWGKMIIFVLKILLWCWCKLAVDTNLIQWLSSTFLGGVISNFYLPYYQYDFHCYMMSVWMSW